MSADIVQMFQCRSNSTFERKVTGSTGNVYTVRFGRVHGQKYSHNWTCDCMAGKHGRLCRHVKQVRHERCGWSQQHNGGAPVNGKCPKCGGKIEAVMVSV